METDNGTLRNGTKGGSRKIRVDSILREIPLSLISYFFVEKCELSIKNSVILKGGLNRDS